MDRAWKWKKIIEEAKKRGGFVTFEQLNEVIPSDTTLSPEQIEDIMAMLFDRSIEVVGGANTSQSSRVCSEANVMNPAMMKLIKEAQKRGFVTFEQLNDVLPSATTSPEYIEDIMLMLSDRGILVVESDESAEAENDDEAGNELGVAIITGGSRGIGRATAIAAAARGFRVVVGYASNQKAADGVVARIEANGGKAIAVKCDVGEERGIVAMFKAADQFGVLSALVNSAGIVSVASRVESMSAERIQRMMAVNVTGSMLCAREAVKRMSTRHGGKGGVIVNLSSVAAKLGSPNTYVDYAASKGAIDSFTVGLGHEVAGEGIRVAAIRPGLIDTEIHASGGDPDRPHRLAHTVPMQRVGTAEEVANAIVWLMSDEASYVTSAILDVSGGR